MKPEFCVEFLWRSYPTFPLEVMSLSFLSRFRMPRAFALRNVRPLTPLSFRSHSSESEGRTAQNDYDYEDDALKADLLTLALEHVNTKGWNHSAIRAGAEALNMSEEVGNIFTEYDLVRFFLQKNNDELESYLSGNKANLKEAMEWKFGRIIPYAPKLNEALAIATQPENITGSIRMLQKLADIMAHYALQDTATDLSWYTKRAGIASIYVATELHLVQDKSKDYQDTWKFLERRVKDFGDFQRGSLLPIANSVPELFSVGLTTALNMIGRNRSR
ncbi:unnamed protein product [Allacma fusca]|uniref:Ubiquinone biosynthesis protein n=1 Tax=Allacma fusca TaxID=39272 RepID=A0A8J2LXZ3_9HEXA|nr:unnamed protein product [Allacma fusca]